MPSQLCPPTCRRADAPNGFAVCVAATQWRVQHVCVQCCWPTARAACRCVRCSWSTVCTWTTLAASFTTGGLTRSQVPSRFAFAGERQAGIARAAVCSLLRMCCAHVHPRACCTCMLAKRSVPRFAVRKCCAGTPGTCSACWHLVRVQFARHEWGGVPLHAWMCGSLNPKDNWV